MNERRQRRVESLLKERIAEIVDQELSDPRLGLVTITRIKVDRDLAVCNVFWTVLGDANARQQTDEVLRRAAGFVQREVAPILRTRSMPRIKFLYDSDLEEAMRVESLMEQIRAERSVTPPTDGDPKTDRGEDEPNAGDAPRARD
ncbi:MAG: 30S ribosome-binding factor RbfA [Planctomycetota bacterium]